MEESVPSFQEQSYKISINENIDTYSPVLKTQAISPEGGDLIYTIESGNDDEMFSVDYKDGVIFVNEGLDYEQRAMHQLTLRATDKLSSGYSEAIVFIILLDANDNAPQFLNDSYYATVLESIPVGSNIIKVEAEDIDTGVNADIEYSIKDSLIDNVFSIDPYNGQITLAKLLDYERQTMHKLTVRATDKGTPPQTRDTIVFINVLDTNDNPPSFDEAEYTFSLSKQASRGQFVGKVRAVDPDYTDNGKLKYSLSGGNEHQVFSIDQNSGSISLINLHNFERSLEYFLNITVSDGVYARSAKLNIHLYSENRYAPRFRQPLYEVSMKENAASGSEVIRLSASDEDGDSVEYSIICEEAARIFSVDEESGVLTNLQVQASVLS